MAKKSRNKDAPSLKRLLLGIDALAVGLAVVSIAAQHLYELAPWVLAVGVALSIVGTVLLIPTVIRPAGSLVCSLAGIAAPSTAWLAKANIARNHKRNGAIAVSIYIASLALCATIVLRDARSLVTSRATPSVLIASAIALGLACLIAVVNYAMTTRRRSLQTLALVGMRRRQIVGIFTLEGFAIALVATVLGTITGVAIPWVVRVYDMDTHYEPIPFTWDLVGLAAAGTLVVATVVVALSVRAATASGKARA